MNEDIQTPKQAGEEYISRLASLIRTTAIPKIKQSAFIATSLCKNRLLPCTQQLLQTTKSGLVKIHNKQHWLKRCGKTMFENSAGLAMAILSTKIVQHFVEVRELSNFWGLFATRPVVSEATYETLSFLIEFFIALMVFTISEHFFEEYRNRQNDQV